MTPQDLCSFQLTYKVLTDERWTGLLELPSCRRTSLPPRAIRTLQWAVKQNKSKRQTNGGVVTHQHERFGTIAIAVIDSETANEVAGRVCTSALRAILTGEVHHLTRKLRNATILPGHT